ncbi:MAG: fibronectin/fibrinogen-binding protein [Lachnospiraceae bacterium]|jgi:predicted ribosome quality control (RQC) complex YloA/Tae2 family protein|nr:fibronectin/fibrinogen-binding protein [Lachnospiraceae bacterium]
MAFDGIVVSNIVRDMKERLEGGRIYKIYQPETDEINLVVKNNGGTHRLMLNASATLPLVYFLSENKNNPMTAPNFCMLLRKHIGNGRIIEVTQPEFERIISIEIEHLDEMGDVCRKKLIIELMGKYSNIIFTDNEGNIIDSVKRIGSNISSVREVLPGREYVLPPSDKKNPLNITKEEFLGDILSKPESIVKAIYTSITGMSKEMSEEICYEAEVDGNFSTDSLADSNKEMLWNVFSTLMEKVCNGEYEPCIVYNDGVPVAFSSFHLYMYEDLNVVKFNDVSEVLTHFYAEKDTYSRMHQKSTDLRKVLSALIERTSKKYDIQAKQLKDVEKREKYRIYGEMLQAYGHEVKEGDKSITVNNYYDNTEITIPLDPLLTAVENANKYFNKYNKMKRTYEASLVLVKESKDTLDQLLLLQNSVELATSEADIAEIRREMELSGFLKEKKGKKENGKQEKSKPLHFVSSDGFHMYVGKNNLQNDRLTFKTAGPKDLWFHAKEMPGSHVIVKLEGAEDVPDNTYEEAAKLAAFYSTGKTSPKVEIDYTRRGNLKKPPESNPGYVIYHTNYSMVAIPDIKGIEEIKD